MLLLFTLLHLFAALDPEDSLLAEGGRHVASNLNRILLEEGKGIETLTFEFNGNQLPVYRIYRLEKNGNKIIRILFRSLSGKPVTLNETRNLLKKSSLLENLIIYPSIEEGDSGFEIFLKPSATQVQIEEKKLALQLLLRH